MLATANANGIGQSELITNFSLPAAGTYFAKITGAQDTVQTYQLDVTASAPATPTLSVSVAAASISENGGSSNATVTRSTGTSGNLTVNLASDDIGEATVPPTVTIPDGSDSVSFNVTAVDDGIIDGTQTVTITASATSFNSGADTIEVTDDEVSSLGPLIGIDFEGSSS